MTSIRSFSEILLSGDRVSEEEKKEFLSIIHDESQRLTRLLDEILDISRLEAGSLDFPLHSIDAKKVIEAALNTISAEIRKNNIKVEQDITTDMTVVSANEDRLRQVLINLLSNAVKYNNADQPEIHIHTHHNKNSFYIDISDNGSGVSSEEASAIFEKFQRGQHSEQKQGAGLGLPISRAIMRAMGGELSLEFTRSSSSFFRIELSSG